MQHFLLLLILLATSLQTQAKSIRTFTPIPPQSSIPEFQTMRSLVPEDIENAPNESYPKITELEYSLFNRSYERENIYSRLTRLENKVFRRNFSGQPLSNRVDNLLSNVDEGIFYGIKNQDLLKLESRVLGRTYASDDTVTRITRLEKEMLGAMQSGNLRERFETVKLAAKHYNTYPEIVQNSRYYSQGYGGYTQPVYRTPNSGVGSVMNNILSKFLGDTPLGTMTGYTPPIYDIYNQYSPYSNSYGLNPNTGFQNYETGNSRRYFDNRNYGGGSSVRILN